MADLPALQLDWTRRREILENSWDGRLPRNNSITEDTSLKPPPHVAMSITKYGDYAPTPVGVHFSIFLSSTYSPVEYCAGSTEKMKFTRNPVAPGGGSDGGERVRFMCLYPGIWNWISKVWECSHFIISTSYLSRVIFHISYTYTLVNVLLYEKKKNV